jgi:hypothetical protein
MRFLIMGSSVVAACRSAEDKERVKLLSTR